MSLAKLRSGSSGGGGTTDDSDDSGGSSSSSNSSRSTHTDINTGPTSDFTRDRRASKQVGGSGDPTDGSDLTDDAEASKRVGGSGEQQGEVDLHDVYVGNRARDGPGGPNGGPPDDVREEHAENNSDDVIETGIYGADRDPGTQTTVDEDGNSDSGLDGSEISGDPADVDSDDWGFGPDRAGTEPDYDGDGEPGGNLTDNPVFNPDIDVDIPAFPEVPGTGDLFPWWAPIAVIGTIGTLLAVVVLWLVRPFVAAFATAR